MSQYEILDVGGTPNPAYHSTWTDTTNAERVHLGSGSSVSSKSVTITPGATAKKVLFFQLISPAVPISTYFVHHGLFRAIRDSGPEVVPGDPGSGISDFAFPMQILRTVRVVDSSGALYVGRTQTDLKTGAAPLGAIVFPSQTIAGPNNNVSVGNSYVLTTEQSFHFGDHGAAALGQYPLNSYVTGDRLVVELGIQFSRWYDYGADAWNTDPVEATISFGSGSFLTFASRTASGKAWWAFSEFEATTQRESFTYTLPHKPTHRPIRLAADIELDLPFLNTDSFNE